MVAAMKGQKLRMGALLHNATLLEHHNEVGMTYCGKAVGNDEEGDGRQLGRVVVEQLVKSLLNLPLALSVEGTSGLIEYDNVGTWK